MFGLLSSSKTSPAAGVVDPVASARTDVRHFSCEVNPHGGYLQLGMLFEFPPAGGLYEVARSDGLRPLLTAARAEARATLPEMATWERAKARQAQLAADVARLQQREAELVKQVAVAVRADTDPAAAEADLDTVRRQLAPLPARLAELAALVAETRQAAAAALRQTVMAAVRAAQAEAAADLERANAELGRALLPAALAARNARFRYAATNPVQLPGTADVLDEFIRLE